MPLQINQIVRRCAVALAVIALPGGALAQTPEGVLSEPRLLRDGIEFATRMVASGDDGTPKDGFFPEFSNMVTGAGWISIGPGYRRWLFRDHALIEGSTAISWRAYKMAQGRIELPRLARSRLVLGSQARWQDLTQITYFGAGPASLDTARSQYRLRTTNVSGYAAVRPAPWLSIDLQVGWLGRPELLAPSGTFRRDSPDARHTFADDIVYTRVDQPSFVHQEAGVTADTRSSKGHPLSGGVYRAAWSAYSDRKDGTFSFRRYEAEAAHFVPLARSRVVVVLHGWLVGSETSAGSTVPFYLMPSLGGGNTLRSYSNYRFHDRNLLLVNAESRIALFDHLDAALFADAGNVAARVADLNLDRTSYGFGLRLHSGRATFARLDVAHGGEGWQLLFRMNEPFRFARLSRRTAAVPFVP